jgi:hypothetical protein
MRQENFSAGTEQHLKRAVVADKSLRRSSQFFCSSMASAPNGQAQFT